MIDLEEFKKLAIWKQFDKDKSTSFEIDGLVDRGLALLDRYYLAFPKYTLHNRQHQKNIIRLIGEFLGDKVKKLSKLECALIILSAIYHDIGMVFSDKQLKDIEKEPTFKLFLNENIKAKLDYNENSKKISEDIAEWYCRWMHAKRVWYFLDDLDKFKWGTVSFRDALGHICESHNSEANTLIDDKIFETDYLNNADLRFCAVLLRLGDILDFDNSRTPQSVYEFLDLDNPKNRNEQISRDEWNKHLCSDGFSFEHEEGQVKLKFTAGPKHPQIEKNIQTFLDIIEDELIKCQSVLIKCSKKWRDFKIPLSINRLSIKSQNYKKGDYRLSLDESQIIKLLAGENLYDNEFVFIRELLQNAIDTSRMREYHENSEGNVNFKIQPIQITTWVDNIGYRWVRLDDFGMGINEYVLTNHLLKKGNSFYNSDFFKIQKLFYKEKTTKDFTPISRFGIGLLSCFILGDTVEINTRSVPIKETNTGEEKIRVSIEGLQGQYFFQTENNKHIPLEMPKIDTNEKAYRYDYGTSIAVRINKSKDHSDFEDALEQMIKGCVLCSPVDIFYSGKKVGLDFDKTLNSSLTNYKFHPFTSKNKSIIEEIINEKISAKIGIEIFSIDLTSQSKNPNFKGQIFFVRVRCDDFFKVKNRNINDYEDDEYYEYFDEYGRVSPKATKSEIYIEKKLDKEIVVICVCSQTKVDLLLDSVS